MKEIALAGLKHGLALVIATIILMLFFYFFPLNVKIKESGDCNCKH